MRKIARFTIDFVYEITGDLPKDYEGKQITEESLIDYLAVGMQEGVDEMCNEFREDEHAPVEFYKGNVKTELLGNESETDDTLTQTELPV